MSTTTIYTLWASMKNEDPSPWMIAAEDEYSWEGDPDRCTTAFQTARANAEKNGWDTREITLLVPLNALLAPFEPSEVEAQVQP